MCPQEIKYDRSHPAGGTPKRASPRVFAIAAKALAPIQTSSPNKARARREFTRTSTTARAALAGPERRNANG
jgi:hypothetical protein